MSWELRQSNVLHQVPTDLKFLCSMLVSQVLIIHTCILVLDIHSRKGGIGDLQEGSSKHFLLQVRSVSCGNRKGFPGEATPDLSFPPKI